MSFLDGIFTEMGCFRLHLWKQKCLVKKEIRVIRKIRLKFVLRCLFCPQIRMGAPPQSCFQLDEAKGIIFPPFFS
jgi:hypothetical protein